MEIEIREPTQPEIDASIRKMEAEARKATAEAKKAEANALLFENELAMAEVEMVAFKEKEAKRLASDHHHRTFRFTTSVNDAAVKAAIDKLSQWHRIDPECAVTFIINSPGGEIVAGFHLFDTLRWFSDQGHHITTVGLGMAASMGGVILQAGDKRIMGPRSSLLIHEAQFVAGGSMGTIEDQVEFVKSLQERICEIFADRSKLTKAQIKTRWKRKNWWLTAEESLKLGFIDEVK